VLEHRLTDFSVSACLRRVYAFSDPTVAGVDLDLVLALLFIVCKMLALRIFSPTEAEPRVREVGWECDMDWLRRAVKDLVLHTNRTLVCYACCPLSNLHSGS